MSDALNIPFNAEVDAIFRRFKSDYPVLFKDTTGVRQTNVGKNIGECVGQSEEKFAELYRTVILGGDETKFGLVEDTIYEFFGKINSAMKKKIPPVQEGRFKPRDATQRKTLKTT